MWLTAKQKLSVFISIMSIPCDQHYYGYWDDQSNWFIYLIMILTLQRSSLLLLTFIYYCRLGGMVNFTLLFMTNEINFNFHITNFPFLRSNTSSFMAFSSLSLYDALQRRADEQNYAGPTPFYDVGQTCTYYHGSTLAHHSHAFWEYPFVLSRFCLKRSGQESNIHVYQHYV